MRKNILIRQYDSNDCAPACLAMICAHYGKRMDLHHLREKMFTHKQGTVLTDMIAAADSLGFVCKAVRVDQKGFESKFTLPAIAQVLLDDGQSHFVVIKKIYQNKVILLDPAEGKLSKDVDAFLQTFTGLLILLTPNHNVFETKNEDPADKKVFLKFLKLLTPHKWILAMLIAATVVLTLIGIVSAFFNQLIFDEIIPNELKGKLYIYALLFLTLAMLQIGIGFIRAQLALHISQKMDISLVLNYFKHIFNLPMKFFSTKKTGDIITRFSDSFVIKTVLTNLVLTVFLDLVLALVTGIILFNISKELFGIIALVTIINIVIVYAFKAPFKKYNLRKMRQDAILNSTVVESINAINFVKSSNHEKPIMDKIEKEFMQTLRTNFKMQYWGNLHETLTSLVMSMGTMGLITVGALFVIQGEMTIGVLLSFSALSGFFMEPINRLVNMQLEIQEADISMKRISEIMDWEEEPLDSEKKIPFVSLENSIEFQSVDFDYRPGKNILSDINFSIKKGETLAIVGASGSGKSSLAKLLIGINNSTSGNIFIDNSNLLDYQLSSLRKNIGYIQQDVQLLPGTVYENLLLGQEHLDMKDIQTVLNQIGHPAFIHSLDNGYETFIEESGVGLSGGEKQMLNLIRCLLKDPELIILDEATSNMDAVREKEVFEHLYSNYEHKTILIIAHKLNLIQTCDKIIVIKDGRIVETGSHLQLLEEEGHYLDLWNAQNGEVTKRLKSISLQKEEEIDESEVLIY